MKQMFFFLPILLVFLLLLFSNLFIGTGNYSSLKSILSNETKYYIKRYIFPGKLISQLEDEIDFLKDKGSIFENEKLSKYDLEFKKSLANLLSIKLDVLLIHLLSSEPPSIYLDRRTISK